MKVNFQTIFIFVLIFAIGFFGGYFLNQKVNFSLQNGIDFTSFLESWNYIEDKFYKFSDANATELRQKMLYGAIDGMVQGLGDPYSDFLTPEESSQFQEDMSGSYEGIGAEIGMQNDILTIISPIEGTPAKAAGLLPGDQILEINNEKTAEMTLTQATMKIRGKEGTEVNLKIQRGNKIFDLKIKRAKITLPTLDFKMLDDNIAYIQLYNFYENASPLFKETANKILSSGSNKIILDLRNNPGGYLNASTDIANFFIKKGNVILKEESEGENINEIYSRGPAAFANFKIVILINKGSASASEILAGAIKENNPQVTIIGEKSFGKGTVQEMITLKDSSSLKLTVARWLLPSGKSIDEEGISPDIEIQLSEEDIKTGEDPQLEKAIEKLISL